MPRKLFTHDNDFDGLPIQQISPHGSFIPILARARALFERMMTYHYRVFVVRIDLDRPGSLRGRITNDPVSEFMAGFTAYLNSCQPRIDHEFLWVLEIGDVNEGVHHHAMLLLDGSRTRNFFGPHLQMAQKLWCIALGVPFSPGLVHLCPWREFGDPEYPFVRHDGVLIDRGSTDCEKAYHLAFQRFSYVAKGVRHEDIPEGMGRYGSSHLR
jgi:hypothetical protein